MQKEKIRRYGKDLGADAVGFADVADYKSPRTPDPQTLLPGVRSLVVLAYREPDGALDSPVPRIAMTTRLAIMDLSKKNNYLMMRFIEDQYKARAASIALSYPLNMNPPQLGVIGDVSLRHAAVAAGLGIFGRHNIVIHPGFGTRVLFTAVLTDLPLSSDPPVTEKLCDECGACVAACPAHALDEEGKTDVFKCLRVNQPYGIGAAISFVRKFTAAAPDQQKAMLMDPQFLSMYQAITMGFQYECFRCEAVCPAGRR